MNKTYVIGHMNPDTDSIASAMGYAWLLSQRDGSDIVAARAGPINEQTAWLLNKLDLQPPELLADASTQFEADLLGGLRSSPLGESTHSIADPLHTTSPTTTDRDHEALERLSRWAFVGGSPLEGDNLDSFGEQVLNVGTGLASRDPKDVVQGDLKIYDTHKGRFGVAQVEVTDLDRILTQIDSLSDALDHLREREALEFTALMITDIVGGSSRLMFSGKTPFKDELPYRRLQDGTFSAEEVVSRKKKLIPVLLALLEG